MKKIILLLCMLVLPIGVLAMENSEVFNVGDDVSVALYDNYKEDAANGFGFHVLRKSDAGEEYVWLIYDGSVDEGSPVTGKVYDEIDPQNHPDLTVVFSDSYVNQILQKVVNKEGKKWNVEEARILDASDLEYLQITKTNGVYQVPKKYSFLVPEKNVGVSSLYNYWTSINATEEDNVLAVYAVVYNESPENEDCANAYLKKSELRDKDVYGIRPVVRIKKQYILCNNSKVPEQPDTGITDFILPLGGVALISAIAILTVRRKNAFSQI